MSTSSHESAVSPAEAPPAKTPVRYRAVCPLAVISLLLGVLSPATLIEWLVAVVPMAGIVTGWKALRAIRRTPEELTGIGIAKAGIALSAVFWAIGYGWLWYAYHHQAPPGYRAITFASLQPEPDVKDQKYPPLADELEDNRVFIKGYMMAGRQVSGIKSFVLVSDNGFCMIGTHVPRQTQMIAVKLDGSLRTEYTTHLVGVGGVFKLIRNPDPNEKRLAGLVYEIQADCLRP